MKLLEPSFWTARSRAFFTRLTFTRFTILYFSFALASCSILVVLQATTLVGNHQGVQALSGILAKTNGSQAKDGLPVFLHGKLALCDGIPDRSDVVCHVLWGRGTVGSIPDNGNFSLSPRDADDMGYPLVSGAIETRIGPETLDLPNNCIYSLRWLLDTLQDGIREDVVTLCFQIWLFSLAVVTLVNESIPHLAAALFGHVLGTGWAGYRVQSTSSLTDIYRGVIVPELCAEKDFLGNWWDQRRAHAIGIIVVNACTLVALMYLSYRLLKVYASQSFARVGASDQIRRIYKIILLFSASLQLTGFFSLASIGIWLDKINQGTVRSFAIHGKLYLAAFIVTLVLLVPWLILGWVCVRQECIRRYAAFCAISLFLVTLFTALFFSRIYRFIFVSWSFFATITVTGYICVVIAAILGIICRFNFGKGLVHYLGVEKALAGVNFTADTFYDHKLDPETAFPVRAKLSNAKRSNSDDPFPIKTRGSSVYSGSDSGPIILSSTPPDVKSLISVSQEPFGGPRTNIVIIRNIETKEDPLPPIPAKGQRPTSIVSRASPLLRVSELPERLSSLTSLRQALSEFPTPPAVAPSVAASRYAIAPKFRSSQEARDGKTIDAEKNGRF